MDLTDQIEQYLKVKNYSQSTLKSHRSILGDFNIWQMHRPTMRMREKVIAYERYVRENCFRKPKTADKQIGVIRKFSSWLEETGRVEAFRLDEQLLGRPQLRRVPDAPVGPDEMMEILHVISRSGGAFALRDGSIAALALTCGLTATEISSLNVGAVSDFGRGDELYYCGQTIPMPRVTALLLKWYLKDRRPQSGFQPLFVTAFGDEGNRLTSEEVRFRLSALLELVGSTYEDAVPGDAQFRVAQRFRALDEQEKKAAAAIVQAMSFDAKKMPHAFVQDLRERFVETRRDARHVPAWQFIPMR